MVVRAVFKVHLNAVLFAQRRGLHEAPDRICLLASSILMSRGDAPTIGVGVFDGFPLTLERSILLACIGTWRVPKHHVHIEAIALVWDK